MKIAQLPSVVEALSGIDLKELVSKIPAIKEAMKTEKKG